MTVEGAESRDRMFWAAKPLRRRMWEVRNVRTSEIPHWPWCLGFAEAGTGHQLGCWPGCEEPQKGCKRAWIGLSRPVLPASHVWLVKFKLI